MLQLVLFTLVLGLNSAPPRLPLQSSNCLKGLGSIYQSHPEYSDVTCKKKNSRVDQHVSPVVPLLFRLFSVALSESTKLATSNSAILQFCNFAFADHLKNKFLGIGSTFPFFKGYNHIQYPLHAFSAKRTKKQTGDILFILYLEESKVSMALSILRRRLNVAGTLNILKSARIGLSKK